MKKFLLLALLLIPMLAGAQASVNWHDETRDTARINEVLKAASGLDRRVVVDSIARMFLGTPYVASTLEIEPERVTVNTDGMDCTTFVDNVLALARTVMEGRSDWRDFIYNLEWMRYRQGRVNGWSSRLHYISDWIVDNVGRGNVKEITSSLDASEYRVKSLDFMTEHADLYPALADRDNLEKMRDVERGYRNHRYPQLAVVKINKNNLAQMRPGDVVAITTKTPGLDVVHLGILTMVNGELHLLHASSKEGKVTIDPRPLKDHLRQNRSYLGIRVLRLAAY